MENKEAVEGCLNGFTSSLPLTARVGGRVLSLLPYMLLGSVADLDGLSCNSFNAFNAFDVFHVFLCMACLLTLSGVEGDEDGGENRSW